MTENQAISVLEQEFVSSSGFLSRLQQGHGIDQRGVAQVRKALGVLRVAWTKRDCIPKDALYALMQFDNALPSHINSYPELRLELLQLNSGLDFQINECLMPEDPGLEARLLEKDYTHAKYHESLAENRSLTEHDAIEIVQEHIAGGPGLVTSLRMGQGIDPNAVDLVHRALNTLEKAWAERTCVPKEIAIFVVAIRSAILASQDYYPDLHDELADIASDIAERIMHCLRQRNLHL